VLSIFSESLKLIKMKIIYYINKIILLLTAILYITIFYGLYAQIVLGFIQVLSSLILLFFWKRINKKQKVKIYIYWILITIYGLCWLAQIGNHFNTFMWVLGLIIIPLSLSIYFFTILNQIKNNK